ncbi:hypothetical protein [Polyangium jinanense]|uniref:Cytochrome c domain-containing protein n=1 Tax=Polyangium jinanense TaxID=2829994 RepID=A0A9X3X394_9BACT|nr:hypothetical protein [Polyangium jinanense]MDC3961091.1 hypothetical protein [Polyangium jinanense]MDC3982832.1 hypothetical protein [Polyangium jinanense]
MRFSWGYPIAVAAAFVACKGGGEKTAGPTPSPAETTSAAANGAATAPAPKEKPKAVAREGSTIARSPSDDALYVADEERGVVHVIAMPVDVAKPAQTVKVPGQPAQVLALADRVLVTIRSEGAIAPGTDLSPEEREASAAPAPTASASAAPAVTKAKGPEKYEKPKTVPSATGPGLLLVMRKDAEKGLVVESRIELPEDAWGVAVTPDESTAIVTSAWTHKVSGVDLATGKVRFSVDVAREPRAAVVHPSGKAVYVTHLVGTDLTRIDGIDGEAASARRIKLPASPLRTPVGATSNASLAYSAVLSPDGKKLYVARHALGGMGPQVWMGVSAVDVLLTTDDTPLAPTRLAGPKTTAEDATGLVEDQETGGEGPRTAPNPFVQPRAIVYKKSTDTLLVASEGTDALSELYAGPIDPALFIAGGVELRTDPDPKYKVATGCGAPSGIALAADEKSAYVFCRATHSMEVAFFHSGKNQLMRLGEEPLPAQAALGRKLYYNGTDEVTSGGMGCAGCHPEGRDDGHVWHERAAVGQGPNFFAGAANMPGWDVEQKTGGGFARQTPMLAGRVVYEGPYGWHAESPHLTHRLTNGFLLHRWGDLPYGHDRKELTERAMALRAFLRLGLVPPPRKTRELSDEEKKGQEVFLRVETKCAGCHVPEMDYSDRAPYPVYSKLPPPESFEADPELGYKTPSLRFVGGTAPYAHDGRFSTLEELIERNDDRMGNTNQLTKPERTALVAFLRTL